VNENFSACPSKRKEGREGGSARRKEKNGDEPLGP